MAFTDIYFSEGEGQDFLVELPSVVYVGSLGDILTDADGSQQIVHEIPEDEGGGGNIFIMSE